MKFKVDNIKNYDHTRGWICGFFMPKGIQKTSEVEIKYENLKPGETSPYHYHPRGTTYSIVAKGKLKFFVEGEEIPLSEGDFVIIPSGTKEAMIEVSEPSTLISVHSPSLPDNKVLAE